jgi:heme exporter protein A
VLEACGVECVRGDRTLFSDLDLALQAGQLLRVVGANGVGKTSLLRILCGLRAPSQGTVLWSGIPIAKAREDFHRNLLYVGHLSGLKDDFSAVENLTGSSAVDGSDVGLVNIIQALDILGVENCSRIPVRHLSQGQKRRVTLARLLLAAERPLWILDEPFNALDVRAVALVEGLLTAHAAAGGTVIFTTHLEPSIDSIELTHLDLDRFSTAAR